VQGGGQLDYAQAGAEVAAAAADRLDQVIAQFAGDRRQLVFVEPAQVGGRVDPRQARIACGVHHARIFTPPVAGGKARRPGAAASAFRICRAGG
jgi:hypothetical protein